MKLTKTITALSILLAANFCTSCSSDDSEVDEPNNSTPSSNELVVDLGLSVKWATCNLGADSPEEIGNYYAWGETTTKDEYTETSYFDSNYSIFKLSGDNTIGGTNRDAAYLKLGKDWRMPTAKEINELVNSCSWTKETVNGVHGMRGTASNGNSIFLPVTGMFAGNSIQSTSQGCYWGSELYTDNARSSKFATMLTFFLSGDVHASNYYRYEGMVIRPVYVGTDFKNDENQSPEDDPVTPPSDEIEDNLSTEAKLFVGYWSNSGGSREYCPGLYLSADGICFAIYEKQDNKWDYDYTWYTHVDKGYWTYDNETKMFATSIGWQFEVTLSNQWAWAGIYKKGSKTYNQSLNKLSNLSVAQFLLERAGWLSESNEPVDLKGYTISEDENEEDYSFNYAKNNEKGTLTIQNPFYLSKSSLIFTGSLNETLHQEWK